MTLWMETLSMAYSTASANRCIYCPPTRSKFSFSMYLFSLKIVPFLMLTKTIQSRIAVSLCVLHARLVVVIERDVVVAGRRLRVVEVDVVEIVLSDHQPSTPSRDIDKIDQDHLTKSRRLTDVCTASRSTMQLNPINVSFFDVQSCSIQILRGRS